MFVRTLIIAGRMNKFKATFRLLRPKRQERPQQEGVKYTWHVMKLWCNKIETMCIEPGSRGLGIIRIAWI